MKPIRNILLAGFLMITACLAVVYTACNKDHCNNVVCQNLGACDGGNCTCLAGFEGNRCQTLSRDKFIYTFSGSDTCSNYDSVVHTYQLRFTTVAANPVEMTLNNFLGNVNDSALCTMWTTDSFSFLGSNNATTYSGTGTLHADTLRLLYQVKLDTFSYNCEYVGGLGI